MIIEKIRVIIYNCPTAYVNNMCGKYDTCSLCIYGCYIRNEYKKIGNRWQMSWSMAHDWGLI